CWAARCCGARVRQRARTRQAPPAAEPGEQELCFRVPESFRRGTASARLPQTEACRLPSNSVDFAEERDERSRKGGESGGWKVLIVDDVPDVHSLTRLLLRNFRYRVRGLVFLSAFSAAE